MARLVQSTTGRKKTSVGGVRHGRPHVELCSVYHSSNCLDPISLFCWFCFYYHVLPVYRTVLSRQAGNSCCFFLCFWFGLGFFFFFFARRLCCGAFGILDQADKMGSALFAFLCLTARFCVALVLFLVGPNRQPPRGEHVQHARPHWGKPSAVAARGGVRDSARRLCGAVGRACNR